MGCRCGANRQVKALPIAKAPTQGAKSIPTPPPQTIVRPAQRNVAGLRGNCPKCSWVLKLVKYIDVRTGTPIERITCTNRGCPNFNKPI